jgi:glycosyltransferase involved in cell wall biosynthesis
VDRYVRVLIVTQYFWPENFRINDLALGLVERGHEVTVFTGKPNYPDGTFFQGYGFFGRAEEDFRGVRVLRAPLIPRGSGGRLGLTLNFLSFALFGSLLAPLRCKGAFDAILVYEPSPVTVGLPALILKRVKRAPLLFWVQDLWPETLSATGVVRSAWILKRVEQLVRFIYRHCDLILVQSRAFIARIESLGVPADKLRYFPNSAEELYRPAEASSQPPSSSVPLPNGFRVMFAGNIGAAQDFSTILAAAERLRAHRDIHWTVLGDGRMQDWVEAEIARRNLSDTVHLLGRHPVRSMAHFFAAADVMLVTLKQDPAFALTIPSKVQSYLACGRPIVAALDGEGARVIEESGAGVAVGAGDAAALAEGVLRLHRMPKAEREAMGAQGRRYFEQHFERDLLLVRLEQWMAELATGNRCAS